MRTTTRHLMIAVAAIAALLSAFEAGRRAERARYHRFDRNIFDPTLQFRIPDAWIEDLEIKP